LDSLEIIKAKKYIKLLDKFNLIEIEIFGFTDSDGKSNSNIKLSQKRINTVSKLLEERGYNTKRKAEAKGEENPIYNNETVEKYKNRRVEVVAYYSSKKKTKKTKKVLAKNKPILNSNKKKPRVKVEDFKKGKIISLPSVQFYGGTANFLPGSEEILDEVISILRENLSLKIEIGGHICCGNDMVLSTERAFVVYEYLVNYGVNRKMLIYKGYNNTQPKYGNIMNSGNRRVELKVL